VRVRDPVSDSERGNPGWGETFKTKSLMSDFALSVHFSRVRIPNSRDWSTWLCVFIDVEVL